MALNRHQSVSFDTSRATLGIHSSGGGATRLQASAMSLALISRSLTQVGCVQFGSGQLIPRPYQIESLSDANFYKSNIYTAKDQLNL
jgi:hypothetical protein